MGKKKKTPPEMEAAAEKAAAVPEQVTRRRTVLTLQNGAKFEVLRTEGKYIVCQGATFRRGNPHIVSVKEEDAL